MARIKGGLNAKKKHNRVLKLAKGNHEELMARKGDYYKLYISQFDFLN